ncbi:MAG: glucokinase [Burkholderiales bacterium]|uniref:glucokinase n=1 Tax=Inhella sp. TaxID=1921806 RepID=UPI001AC156EA|nr:glucokinase [Burkholderiales bacterium]
MPEASTVLETHRVAPYPWLLADVGGSNARFGWVPHAGCVPQHVRTLAVAEYPEFIDAARAYLDSLAHAGLPGERQPGSAAFAVATAPGEERVELTNSGWGFSRRRMRQQLGLRGPLLVLNDFEALALSLPSLRANQWQSTPTQASGDGSALAAPRFDVPVAVVGPGTGLGVAGLLPTRAGWLAVPGEGGHATLAPADDFESALLAAARREFPHVSAERFLSGIGLPVLYRSLAEVRGERALPEVDAKWIVERALAQDDALASACIESFCAMLGGFAGSVALTFAARGGVFIGGGIVPRLGPVFERSAFRERFEAKGRFSGFLRAVPTALVTDTLVALDGAAQALLQHA